uniref:UPAR/Ly6 domain-containing protein n=1 Tax=Leptobrachium leishanense TaxID=445787 RepID=A0A8C5RAF8_9ANUR
MKFLLSVICVLSVSFGVGYCLQCVKCDNQDGDSCSGSLETCDGSVTRCLSLLVVAEMDGKTISQITKSCAVDSKMCSTTANMTFGSMELYIVPHCCEEDKCNKENVKLPAKDQKENGVECPSCMTIGDKECVPTNNKCTGAQTKCLSYNGEVYAYGKCTDFN